MCYIKTFLKEIKCGYWLDKSDAGWRPVAGSCEHQNETSVWIKGEEFLDRLSYRQLLKKDFG
jgi:hypothetical protein